MQKWLSNVEIEEFCYYFLTIIYYSSFSLLQLNWTLEIFTPWTFNQNWKLNSVFPPLTSFQFDNFFFHIMHNP